MPAAPLRAPRQPPLLLGVRRTVDDDDDVVDEQQHQHQQQQQRTPDHVHSPRCGCAPSREELPRLTFGERRLVDWLVLRLGFVGAEVFVLRYGGAVIMRALKSDGLMTWKGEGSGSAWRRRWVLSPSVRNPAGFLRWAVGQRVRPVK